MSSMEPRPNFGDSANTEFDIFMESLLPQNQGFEEEFAEKDRIIAEQKAMAQRSAEREAIVIGHLKEKIDDMGAIEKMLASLKQERGIENPTCDHVMTIFDQMTDDPEYRDAKPEFFDSIARIYGLTMIVEQLARSETARKELSKDDILTLIVVGKFFTPGEREVLINATDHFLASE